MAPAPTGKPTAGKKKIPLWGWAALAVVGVAIFILMKRKGGAAKSDSGDTDTSDLAAKIAAELGKSQGGSGSGGGGGGDDSALLKQLMSQQGQLFNSLLSGMSGIFDSGMMPGGVDDGGGGYSEPTGGGGGPAPPVATPQGWYTPSVIQNYLSDLGQPVSYQQAATISSEQTNQAFGNPGQYSGSTLTGPYAV